MFTQSKQCALAEAARKVVNPLFVFKRDGYRTYALTADEAQLRQSQLKSDGWEHTQTIDPYLWLKSFVESPALVQESMLQEVRRGPTQ